MYVVTLGSRSAVQVGSLHMSFERWDGQDEIADFWLSGYGFANRSADVGDLPPVTPDALISLRRDEWWRLEVQSTEDLVEPVLVRLRRRNKKTRLHFKAPRRVSIRHIPNAAMAPLRTRQGIQPT